MLVCVLKHTPAVFSTYSQNETMYSGLEVEVGGTFVSEKTFSHAKFRFLDNSGNITGVEFLCRILRD